MPDFEQSVEQLERIIEQVESGQVSLEESLSRYEQGMKLVQHCRSILERAETRIKELTVDASGELTEAGEAEDIDP